MATKIGTQTGIVASNGRFKALDPGHDVGYDNLANTQNTLVAGHNEYQDRISALEVAFHDLPFPVSS